MVYRPPNPQPKLAKRTTTPGGSVRAGAGMNAKGSSKKLNPGVIPKPAALTNPKKPRGFFQWGAGQYGYQNPAGQINWEATKPLQKGWREQNKMMAMPAGAKPPTKPKAALAPWMDTDYMKETRQMEHGLQLEEGNFSAAMKRMQDAYGVGESGITQAIGRRTQQEEASLGARGIANSGMVDRSALERENDSRQATRQLDADFGATRQQELNTQIELLRTQLAENKQGAQSSARKRFEGKNKFLEANNQSPMSIDLQTGFFQKGSTWFYRNPAGVTVSLGTKTPDAIRKKLNRKKQAANNKVVKVNGQMVNEL